MCKENNSTTYLCFLILEGNQEVAKRSIKGNIIFLPKEG
jgi:hypothetical protein